MDRDTSEATVARRIDETIHGLSAEQILLSSYFGLKSTRDQDTVDELIALSKRVQNNDPDAAIAFLRRLSGHRSAATLQSTATENPKVHSGPGRTKSTPSPGGRSKPKKHSKDDAGEAEKPAKKKGNDEPEHSGTRRRVARKEQTARPKRKPGRK